MPQRLETEPARTATSAELAELFSNEKQVTNQTPPIFIAHARDDRVVPGDNSRDCATPEVARLRTFSAD